MAARCRLVGNALEYAVCRSLLRNNIAPIDNVTRDKIKRLEVSHNALAEPDQTFQRKLSKMDAVIKHLGMCNDDKDSSTNTFKLIMDASGAKGDTADVIVYGREGNVLHKLSVKNNNTSIKHQRPNKLYLQLGLAGDDATEYQTAYKAINTKYYEMWRGRVGGFADVTFEEKTQWYREINELTKTWLLKDPAHVDRYLRFVLDIDPDKIIVRWNPKPGKESIDLIKYDETAFSDLDSLNISDSSFFYLTFKDGKRIKMRLHNASSRITRTLSLKYDTSIEHCGRLFSLFTF